MSAGWLGMIAAVLVGLGLPALAQEASMELPGMPLHDPFILAYAPAKTYYLYTSNVPSLTGVRWVGTMAYTSTDLKHWTKPRVVFTVPEGFWAESGGWAPEVHAYRGRFYLLTTLHNEKKLIPQDRPVGHDTYARGTILAVSDSPDGPFVPVSDGPVAPSNFMTLDGTLYVDRGGKPWMVYAHEWLQVTDGTMEAVPLKADLTAADGPPMHLFKASDAPWIDAQAAPTTLGARYVTDGPELFRTRDGHLLMLWSSYEHLSDGVPGSHYVQTLARSVSGELKGPWVQLEPLVRQDSGHGMLFTTFDGQLMMVLHRPFKGARGKLYEMRDLGDRVEVVRERVDLDGDDTIPAVPPVR